jgi:hypothetical protein
VAVIRDDPQQGEEEPGRGRSGWQGGRIRTLPVPDGGETRTGARRHQELDQ